MRSTKRQDDILNILSGDYGYSEVGTQPYSAASVTHMLKQSSKANSDISINSVRTTLKMLVSKGLVTTERRETEVLSGLGYIQRELDHYWNASTEHQDRLAASKHNAETSRRQQDALDRMFTV